MQLHSAKLEYVKKKAADLLYPLFTFGVGEYDLTLFSSSLSLSWFQAALDGWNRYLLKQLFCTLTQVKLMLVFSLCFTMIVVAVKMDCCGKEKVIVHTHAIFTFCSSTVYVS